MEIFRLLYPQQLSAERDKMTFNRWMESSITTKQAIREFKENNHLENDEYIDENEFIIWLRSLGYWR